MPNSSNRTHLDPQDLFAFLATVDEYPTNGLQLSRQAQAAGAAPELIHFFEAIPGQLQDENEVVAHAMSSEAPTDHVLDIPDSQPTEPLIPAADATLLMKDVTGAE